MIAKSLHLLVFLAQLLYDQEEVVIISHDLRTMTGRLAYRNVHIIVFMMIGIKTQVIKYTNGKKAIFPSAHHVSSNTGSTGILK
jgi:hypothetical protein